MHTNAHTYCPDCQQPGCLMDGAGRMSDIGKPVHGSVVDTRPGHQAVWCGDCDSWVDFDASRRDAITAMNTHRLLDYPHIDPNDFPEVPDAQA